LSRGCPGRTRRSAPTIKFV